MLPYCSGFVFNKQLGNPQLYRWRYRIHASIISGAETASHGPDRPGRAGPHLAHIRAGPNARRRRAPRAAASRRRPPPPRPPYRAGAPGSAAATRTIRLGRTGRAPGRAGPG
jgi:hypothetical protein